MIIFCRFWFCHSNDILVINKNIVLVLAPISETGRLWEQNKYKLNPMQTYVDPQNWSTTSNRT